MRIRYVLHNAYAGGGTVRTTLSMANALAERGHDVEVASVVQRKPQPSFPVAPGVRLVSLTGGRPSPSHPGTPRNAVRWATRAALRRTHSTLAHPRDARCATLTPVITFKDILNSAGIDCPTCMHNRSIGHPAAGRSI